MEMGQLSRGSSDHEDAGLIAKELLLRGHVKNSGYCILWTIRILAELHEGRHSLGCRMCGKWRTGLDDCCVYFSG